MSSYKELAGVIMYKFKIVSIKVFFLLILSITASMMGFFTYNNYKKANEIKDWKQVNATIVESSIKKVHTSKSISYCPIVIVNYMYQNQVERSKLQISYGPCSVIKSNTEKTLIKFPKGDTISAVLNPKTPSEIRISKYTLDKGFYFGFLIFIVNFGLVIYMLITPAEKMTILKDTSSE